ncbi:hypothetical protein Gbem_1746 [Citrifermentans bemidjiense Bem]|uniref:Uncharacterized protein n=1 Tax=Citrifermentans bemidjiense (strain ATCC BAA-1014 / DSM 16622 / JCM 12645 / Bem) TaxID=404380 RepID=B5EA56_CITBB|nr:hypothetical protein [Citrifermentans bemidjiense]ACH38762.1 hypothetical protein Gbem_1746 [Citrifermentans bemidjiense Bem]
MPYSALQKLSSRTPTSNKYPYQTDAKLEVVAKATDPFVQQGLMGQDVIKALSAINPTLKAYGDVQEANKPENVAKAKMDAKNGTYSKPDSFLNQGSGYSETWRMTNGEAKMSKVSGQHLQDLHDNNYFIDSPDPQAAIKENYQQHYEAAFADEETKDPFTMAGASELYHATEAKATAGYQAAFNKKAINTHEQNLNDIALTTVQDAFREGIHDPAVVRNLLANLRHGVDTNLVPANRIGSVVTNALVGAAKANMMDTQLPLHERQEFNMVVFDALRTSDKDGNSWYKAIDPDTGKTLNRNAVDDTEAYLHKVAEEEENQMERKLLKDQEENSSGIMAAILSTGHSRDLNTFYPILKEAADLKYISREGLKQIENMLNTTIQGGTHIIENPTDVNALYYNVLMGKVSSKKVYEELAGERIRPDTAQQMMGLIERNKAHMENLAAEGRNNEQQLFAQSYTQQHQTLYTLYYKLDEEGKPDVDSAERWGAVQDYYNDLVYSQKKSPVQAKMEVMKAFPADGADGGFKTAQEAQDEGKRAKVMYGTGAINKKEFDRIMAKVKPWAYRAANRR